MSINLSSVFIYEKLLTIINVTKAHKLLNEIFEMKLY